VAISVYTSGSLAVQETHSNILTLSEGELIEYSELLNLLYFPELLVFHLARLVAQGGVFRLITEPF
jgi:hypothetical protein